MVNKDAHFVMKNGKAEQPLIAKEGLQLYYDVKGKKNTDVHKSTLLDMSGNGRNGALSNFAYEGVSGFRDGLYFDDVDDVLTRPNVTVDECSMNKNLVDVTKFSVGNLASSTGAEVNPYLHMARSPFFYLKAGTYITHITPTEGNPVDKVEKFIYFNMDKTYYKEWRIDNTQPESFVVDKDCYVRMVIMSSNSSISITTDNIAKTRLQIEEGGVATSYVPYVSMPRMTYQMNSNILGYDSGGKVKRVQDGSVISSNVNFFANSNIRDVSRGTITDKHDNTYLTGWGQYNGGISNPTISYHAHVDTETFGFNVIEYNESDGNRNWKGSSKSGFQGLTKETGDYTISFDLNPTGDGTRIFGGFYGRLNGGTTNAFHAGQFSVTPSHMNGWQRYSTKVTMHADMDFNQNISFYIYGYGFSTNSILYVTNIKLEKGATVTDYNINPSDLINKTAISGNITGDLEKMQSHDFEEAVDGVSPIYTNEGEDGATVHVEIDGLSEQSTESSNVVTNGLVLWLDGRSFNNTGKWKDLRGVNDATTSGFAYTTSSGYDNYGGVVFDGVDDRVTVPNLTTGMLTTGAEAQPVTLEVWAKIPATQPYNGQGILFGKTGYNTGILAFNGQIGASLWSNAPNNKTVKKIVPANTTFHAVATFDNGAMKLYHNGSFVGINSELAGSTYLTLNGPLELGGGAPWKMSGTVYVARVYNRVLTDAEVAQNYNSGVSRVAPCAGLPVAINSLGETIDLLSSDNNRNLAIGTATPRTYSGFTGALNYCPNMYAVYSDGMTAGGKVRVSFDFEYNGFTKKDGYNPVARLQGAGNVTSWWSGAWSTPTFTSLIDWNNGSGSVRVTGEFVVSSSHLKNKYWSTNIRFDYVTSGTFTVSNFKVESGEVYTPWCLAPSEIPYETEVESTYKTKLVVSSPLRSVGAVCDRLFKATDGLWKIERNVGEKVFNGTETINKNDSNPDNYLYYIRASDLGAEDARVSYKISHMKDNIGTSGNPYAFGYGTLGNYNVLYLTLGLAQGENTVNGFKNWLTNQHNQGTPFTVLYTLPTPTYEILSSEMQTNLNNIPSHPFDNYVYTATSTHLSPTIRASFKKVSWFKTRLLFNSLKIYDRALADAEMVKNYKIEKERFGM